VPSSTLGDGYLGSRVRGVDVIVEAAPGLEGRPSPGAHWPSPFTYGETASDPSSQYNGRVYDAGTGFHDYGARLYWPEIGRFVSADSYLGDPANPASLSRYSYVHNNPYKYTDATGHCPSCVLAGVGFVVGGAWAGIASYQNGARGWDLALNILQGGSAGAIVGATLGMAGEAVAGGVALWQAGRAAQGNAPATSSPLVGANYAQKTFNEAFSSDGAFAGQTIDDVAAAVRGGQMSSAAVPVQYIEREGSTLMLNTRSAQALERAGVSRARWTGVNMTGDPAAEARLTGQLQRNGLTSQGTPTVRPSGQ
jgi:RHS repeat-associated protein